MGGSLGRFFLVGFLLIAMLPTRAIAGMASPLPTDYQTMSRLTETAHARIQAISFFAAGVLVCAGIVCGLWNFLQRDFPKLPRLSYIKALALVFLWGLLFVIILTMISGARELLTPGAWTKDGGTYRLAGDAPSPEGSAEDERRQQLERLKTALWSFAGSHEGRLPTTSEVEEVAGDCLEVPEGGGLRYLYIGGLSTNQPATVLVYEPELDRQRRFALLTNGEVVCMTSAEIERFLKRESRP